MANSIMTQELAKIILADTKVRVPIVKFLNSELSSLLDSDSGSQVNVLAPDFGTVTDGPSIDPNDPSINSIRDRIPVNVTQSKVVKAFDQLEKALRIGNFDEAVSTPVSINLASKINTRVFQTVLAGAKFGIQGTIDFGALSDAISLVKTSRVNAQGEDYAGMLSPRLESSIRKTGQNMFANPRLTDDLYYDGLIGNYAGAEFIASPDAGIIKYTTALGSCAVTFVGGINAATQMTLTVPTGVTKIFAGTPFTVPNVNVCDILGNDTGVQAVITAGWNPATADGSWAVSDGGTATVGISQLKVKGQVNPMAGVNGQGVAGATWAVPNVIINGTAGVNATNSFTVNKSYGMGVVFAKNSTAFASRVPGTLGYDSASSNLDNEINVRISRVAEGFRGVEVYRVDVIYGANTMYGQGACGVWAQLD